MTLEEFVVRVKELAQGMRPGEAKVIIEFPRRKTDPVDITTILTRRDRV